MMRQDKFYRYTTWSLLLLNIAMLAFFLLTKPRPPHRPSSHNFQSEVIKTLDLTGQQESDFKALAKEHSDQMRSIRDRQQALLLPYFERVADSTIRIDADGSLSQAQQLEGEKIELTHRHFQEIKALLNEDQLPHFRGLMRTFIDQLILEKRKNPPPPQDFE